MPVVVSAAISVAARSGTDVARGDLGTATVLLAVAGWIVFLVAYDRWGRDVSPIRPRRSETPDEIELPDDPPAVAHALHEGGSPDAGLIGAVVLDLGRRGYLDIVEERREGLLAPAAPGGETGLGWRFIRKETPRRDLNPYENAIYTRLFAAGNETSQRDLVAWAESNRQQARVFLERIRRYVLAELREHGYLEHPSRFPVLLNLAAAGLVLLLGLVALVSGAFIGVLGAASGAFQASRTHLLRRGALSGGERAKEWAEVAHALERVAELEKPPAQSLDDWGRCLVYAAALGVAGEFVAGVAARDGDLLRDDEFAPWYQGVGFDGVRVASIGRLTETLGSTLAAAAEGGVRIGARAPAARP
ncbi:MAG: DUF2207 domain-containing protein [Actinobacteria bacterium]|nr:DUF2207 domain-containing protein [Actinomycetota bacterium]